jgi:hypothetical protein
MIKSATVVDLVNAQTLIKCSTNGFTNMEKISLDGDSMSGHVYNRTNQNKDV